MDFVGLLGYVMMCLVITRCYVPNRAVVSGAWCTADCRVQSIISTGSRQLAGKEEMVWTC